MGDDVPRLVVGDDGEADSDGGVLKRHNSDSISILVTPPDERRGAHKSQSHPHLQPPDFDNSPPVSRRAQWERANLPPLKMHHTARPHDRFTKTTVHVHDGGRLSEPVVVLREEREGFFTPSPRFAGPAALPSPPSSPSWSVSPPPSPPALSPPGSPCRRPGIHLSLPDDDDDDAVSETRKVVRSLEREVVRERERAAPVRRLARSLSLSSASSTSSSALRPGGSGGGSGGGSAGGSAGGGGGGERPEAGACAVPAVSSPRCAVCTPPPFLPSFLHPAFHGVVGVFGISDAHDDWPVVLDVARLALVLAALALLPLSHALFSALFLLSSFVDATHEGVRAFCGRPGDVNPLLHALTDRLLLPCALLATAACRPRTIALCLPALALVVTGHWFDVVALVVVGARDRPASRDHRPLSLSAALREGYEHAHGAPQITTPPSSPSSPSPSSPARVGSWRTRARCWVQSVVDWHNTNPGAPELTAFASHVFVAWLLLGRALGVVGLACGAGFALGGVVRARRLAHALQSLQRVGPGRLRRLKFH